MASRKSAGRPPRYKNAAEMQAKIDAYFTACEGTPLLDDAGNQVLYKGRPVIVGPGRPPSRDWPWHWDLQAGRRCSTTRDENNLMTR